MAGPSPPDAPSGRAQEPVTLHVYDLAEQLKGANKVMKNIGTGVYHAAVEVYGYEWSFGYCEEDTGVFYCEPKENPCFCYKQSVPMGHTELLENEVLDLIENELMEAWPGEGYHLLQRNCCDFSNEFCKRLGVGAVPGWIKSAAGLGAFIDDLVHFKPLTAVIKQGRMRRTRAVSGNAADPESKEAKGLQVLAQGVQDFGLGLHAVTKRTATGILEEGRSARGADEDGGYKPGDFCRGLAAAASKEMKGVLAQGRAARDAPEGGYRFGDLTRGAVSALAKR